MIKCFIITSKREKIRIEWRERKSVHLVQQMFKQDLNVPYNAYNDEYMYIVSGGNEFMESMSEYMEVWKRDRVVFTHIWV